MASIAQMTGTLIDSGCKHIVPVRVSMDTMMHLAKEPDQNAFLREKFRFCAHKNDLLLCVNKPLFREGRGRLAQSAAYPNIISTLGDVPDHVKLAIAIYYNNPVGFSDPATGAPLLDALHQAVRNTSLEKVGDTRQASDPDRVKMKREIGRIPHFSFMGFSLGLGYAHPSSGDTVVSAMIGGMITVQNGGFDICTGDPVMWYWEFERGFFDKDGRRLGAGYNAGQLALTRGETERRAMHQRENGNIHIGNEHHEGKRNIAYPKPFLRHPVLGGLDKMRVFGKAVSNARAWDQVDIMVCTQSI
jgi:hypothetical protein